MGKGGEGVGGRERDAIETTKKTKIKERGSKIQTQIQTS